MFDNNIEKISIKKLKYKYFFINTVTFLQFVPQSPAESDTGFR